MAKPVPRLTPEALREAILQMCEQAGQMLQFTRDGFLQPTVLDKVGPLGRELHLREKRLTDQVAMQLRDSPWSLGKAEHLAFLPAGLERIGDSVEALARCSQGIHREGIPLSDRAMTEILGLFSRVADLLKGMTDAIRTGERAAIARVREEGGRLQAFSDEIALGHQERLIRGVCVPRASSSFLAMLDYFREIERYTRRISLELEKALGAA